jgi:2-polyprenyl-3-methyl-5-hydroxy-6-metoxy-1,4-benzoquinol methylase
MALKWMPARVDAPELLDMGVGTPDDVRDSLADLWRINRWMGGLDAITHYLYPRLIKSGGTILDIGTGSAQIPAAVARWSAARDLPVRILAVDLSARNLCVAQAHILTHPHHNGVGCTKITLIQTDATRLPLAPQSVDYAISSLLLHHFAPEQVIDLLRSAWKVARRGVIMSDAVRGRLPLIAFRIGQPVFARSYLTRYDGMVSIRRAYTPRELTELAREAGLKAPHVYRRTPFHMTLVADK